MLKNPNDSFVFQLNRLNFNLLPLLVAGKNEINFKIIQLKKKLCLVKLQCYRQSWNQRDEEKYFRLQIYNNLYLWHFEYLFCFWCAQGTPSCVPTECSRQCKIHRIVEDRKTLSEKMYNFIWNFNKWRYHGVMTATEAFLRSFGGV